MIGSKGSKIRKILEAIPDDSWVKASDVEEKTGISAHSVGAIISQHLLYELVERRSVRLNGGGCYEYRRLRRIGDSSRLERT